ACEEDLAAAGVEHGEDRARRVPDRVRQDVEAREPHDRGAEDLGEGLAGRDADAKTREEPRTEPHGDPADLRPIDPRPLEQLLEGRRDRLLTGLAGHGDLTE